MVKSNFLFNIMSIKMYIVASSNNTVNNVFFYSPGKYTVWVRAFSTRAEENGLHMGIDGTWPRSGQRIQL